MIYACMNSCVFREMPSCRGQTTYGSTSLWNLKRRLVGALCFLLPPFSFLVAFRVLGRVQTHTHHVPLGTRIVQHAGLEYRYHRQCGHRLTRRQRARRGSYYRSRCRRAVGKEPSQCGLGLLPPKKMSTFRRPRTPWSIPDLFREIGRT